MARIPNDATHDVQESFKEVWLVLDDLVKRTFVDMHGRRLTNVALPARPTDAATKAYVDAKVGR